MVAPKKPNRSHTPKKATLSSKLPQKPVKANQSILTFFKKAEKHEASLFLGATPDAIENEDLYAADDADNLTRPNEAESPNKKRKLSQEPEKLPETEVSVKIEEVPVAEDRSSPVKHDGEPPRKTTKTKIKTPFVMDSDSEDESEDEAKDTNNKAEKNGQCTELSPRNEVRTDGFTKNDEKKDTDNRTPAVKQEDSIYQQFNRLGDIPDEDFPDLDDLEGEEMRVMRFMKEQARLEAEEAGISSEDLADDPLDDDSMTESCPICNGSLAGISIDEATRHVNSCLDGHPIPLPKNEKSTPEKVKLEKSTSIKPYLTTEVESNDVSKRFARAAVPRPGQANPFETNSSSSAPKSAFSALMSNKAEDSAWQEAAAAEHASRGKQAYERTCPFYKIMPGFSICVDAFRYGAVQGCKAYFLSHFHSDHYIGLTAKWCHGPIYCSKVTGSLVRNQLRTAEKWVVELEFDKSYDIPGTEGVTVTMVPANHCPGSSLFLFEKKINSRVQRILHCGDFRACTAHIKHPLLKPETIDSISGKAKQQKIDICYLDTTYLNPRYSFPPQNDVIQACADLCASMNPDPNCKDDVWEKTSGQGTPAVSKFFPNTKPDETGKADGKKKPPQRLLVSKIFASPGKIKICKQLGDPELSALLTSDPLEAQVHMQMLMEIRAETLQEYLNSYKPYFSRIVGLRPSGWNFRPAGKSIGANTPPGSIHTQQILHDKHWRTRFGYKDFVPQRGSTKEAMCFGVPYSEHSSFRELAMFLMCLRIEKVVPTVNVGSEQSRKRMKGWIDRWLAERRRAGLVIPLIEGEDDEVSEKELWDGKPGKADKAYW
ncbi:hypothetical protein F53441_3563 [Fusarium austroafricanum]|uniref:DNA repair metallo-beta-lactamase domain-containing protein n=1 Tax=Fusarium austroafricanum TaxID=2364996 RepID=A0A8H4KMJ3_9HYPO|nr:hypothetical protein F53441_3563 [Fusarium austroafricanum]